MTDLIDALRGYLQHKPECALHRQAPYSVAVAAGVAGIGIRATTEEERRGFTSKLQCSCGLDQLLASVPRSASEETNKDDSSRLIGDVREGNRR